MTQPGIAQFEAGTLTLPLLGRLAAGARPDLEREPGSRRAPDVAENSIAATIPVGKDPDGVAIDLATHSAYVTNYADDSVSVIKSQLMT